jgi:hypothetical protein
MILVIIHASGMESAISGNAATMRRLLQSYVDDVVITVTLPSSTSEREVMIKPQMLTINYNNNTNTIYIFLACKIILIAICNFSGCE